MIAEKELITGLYRYQLEEILEKSRNYNKESYEAKERITTPIPQYLIEGFKGPKKQDFLKRFGLAYEVHNIPQTDTRVTREQFNNLMNTDSGVLHQRRHLWDELDFSPRNIYGNIKRHPLVAGTLLGGLLGAASFAGYTASTIPYTLTAGTAFATIGSLGLGALVGGLLGLGVAGALYYGLFRGNRKYTGNRPNPQYKPDEPRGLWKILLDWITERNIEADQSVARAAPPPRS